MNKKTIRMNKTTNNLQNVWQYLDNASGDLSNALDNLSRMVDLPENIKRQIEMIDIGVIVLLKEEIEDLMNKEDR